MLIYTPLPNCFSYLISQQVYFTFCNFSFQLFGFKWCFIVLTIPHILLIYSFICFYSGVVIADGILRSDNFFKTHGMLLECSVFLDSSSERLLFSITAVNCSLLVFLAFLLWGCAFISLHAIALVLLPRVISFAWNECQISFAFIGFFFSVPLLVQE